MDKMKKGSLKWAFTAYIILCIILSMIGLLIIGYGTNYLQEWFVQEWGLLTQEKSIIFLIISNAQFILMPLWTIFCIGITGVLFYKLELKEPIGKLMDASKKISENQLDFQIRSKKKNELGMLCDAFEDMRMALYENNREMWKSLEERKRLNSAFSHDLRTPLTVLKGYVDFLRQYIPGGKITAEKLMTILSMMDGQIVRLEHYTQKMNAVQKLEDITPDIQLFSAHKLSKNLMGTGKLLCGDKSFNLRTSWNYDDIFIDTELVMQVYENMISNAVRYAENKIDVTFTVSDVTLKISVSDDGSGFTKTALKNAGNAFFRDEKEAYAHFGLGLYICRILCEKCGGELKISNHENGGIVTAEFFCKKISENR